MKTKMAEEFAVPLGGGDLRIGIISAEGVAVPAG
ncbi:hypothetical protein J2805_004835, partial [Arthrobacter oryzae]|nr:hypothetical protein [Arthrobacter oryzae]